MQSLFLIVLLVTVVLGSAVNGTLDSLIAISIISVVVAAVWGAYGRHRLHTVAMEAEDQLQLDIELLKDSKRDRFCFALVERELTEEFGYAPGRVEVGRAIRRRERNLDVVRGVYISQSKAMHGSAILLGLSVFLHPPAGCWLIGVYAFTRLPFIRSFLRT